MRKIITLLLAVAMLAGVVMLSVACGKDPAGPTTTDPGKVTTDNPDNPVTGGESTSTKPTGQTTTNPSGQTTTKPSGQTTTNPSGGTTGGEDPTVEWDGKTKLPGKENVDFGGRTFFIASCDQNDGYTVYPEALKANKLLFEGEVLNALVRFKDVEDLEVGVLPFPLFDENQERYYLHVNNHLPAYGLPTSFANTEILGDFWTLYAAHSRHTVRKAFVDSCKYVWMSDEENGEMMDIILDSRIYDPGYNWNIASSFDTTLVSMVESGDNRFSGYANKQVKSIEANIKAVDDRISELDG